MAEAFGHNHASPISGHVALPKFDFRSLSKEDCLRRTRISANRKLPFTNNERGLNHLQRLSITLPNRQALDNLAGTLARLLATQSSGETPKP